MTEYEMPTLSDQFIQSVFGENSNDPWNYVHADDAPLIETPTGDLVSIGDIIAYQSRKLTAQKEPAPYTPLQEGDWRTLRRV